MMVETYCYNVLPKIPKTIKNIEHFGTELGWFGDVFGPFSDPFLKKNDTSSLELKKLPLHAFK